MWPLFLTNACEHLAVRADEAHFPCRLCAVIWFWGYELSYGAVLKASWFFLSVQLPTPKDRHVLVTEMDSDETESLEFILLLNSDYSCLTADFC